MTAPGPDAFRYSVVVPVYNEGSNIARFCEQAKALLPPGGEFLFVYDFDEDDTLVALASLRSDQKPAVVRTVKTRGRGVRDALVTGLGAATAPVVLVMMADLSDEFAKADEMIRRAEGGADVVCASRYVRGGKQIGGPRLKGILSRVAGLTLHRLAGLPVHDPTNSFKAYRREFLQSTPVESSQGFVLGLELTVKAHFGGGRVEEVPAVWVDRAAGSSRFRLARWLPHYLKWYLWAFRQRWLPGA